MGVLDVRVEHKAFVDGRTEHSVLQNCAFKIEPGQVAALLGPSGCGKSTLLRMIMGLDLDYRGDIRLLGKPVVGVSRDCALMFQDHRLLPWLTVERNVQLAFAGERDPIWTRLSDRTRRRVDQSDRVQEILRLVGLVEFQKRWPRELSGGMSQRAALARALVNVPRLLLLDEPFSSLADVQRRDLHQVLLRSASKLGTTVLIVTHDAAEAVALADVIIEMTPSPARVRRIVALEGTEREPYHSGDLDAVRPISVAKASLT